MRDDYFDWLYDLVCNSGEYHVLCAFLHGKDFSYTLPMDGNRYEDGISMRYRYGWECDIPRSKIAEELDTRPCSMFEMMVALAVRIEDDIMAEPGIDHTFDIFEEMLKSSGMIGLTDRNFDENRAERCVHNIIERDYAKNGQGGLFTVNNRPDRDLRDVEIWYQAMWYINTLYSR